MRACKDCRWCVHFMGIPAVRVEIGGVPMCVNPDIAARQWDFYEGVEVLLPMQLSDQRRPSGPCGTDAKHFEERT